MVLWIVSSNQASLRIEGFLGSLGTFSTEEVGYIGYYLLYL